MNNTPAVRPTTGSRLVEDTLALAFKPTLFNITLDDSQKHVAFVVDTVKQAVVATMGPNGQLVAIRDGVSVYVTKDGVTVARALQFDDSRQEMIGRIMTEAAIKTDDECGDGTTTTTLLTADLYQIFAAHRGYREHAYIEKVVKGMINHLEEATIRVTTTSPELYQLALTSSNNDEELSQMITDIYASGGEHFPEIEFREGNSNKDLVQRTNGLPISMEFSSPAYSANGQGEPTALTQYVPIVIDDQLRNQDTRSIVEFFGQLTEKLVEQNIETRHILLIARTIDNNINSVIMSLNNSPKQFAAINQGRHYRFIGMQTHTGGSIGTSLMGDIATILDAPMIPVLADAVHLQFKVCEEKVVLNTGRSLVEAPSAEARVRIAARVKDIQEQLQSQEMSARYSPRTRFNEARVRALNGELVTVLVGGETLSEVKERKDRFVDVTKAVRSALVNGILPGCGTALAVAAQKAVQEAKAELISPNFELPILEKLYDLGFGPLEVLLGNEAMQDAMVYCDDKSLPYPALGNFPVTNLTTGQKGTPVELGIYDTAYASITALKGGLQTAKILATLSGLLLGDKLNAVKVQG